MLTPYRCGELFVMPSEPLNTFVIWSKYLTPSKKQLMFNGSQQSTGELPSCRQHPCALCDATGRSMLNSKATSSLTQRNSMSRELRISAEIRWLQPTETHLRIAAW